MSKLLIATFLMILTSFKILNSQTTLVAGDIVIIGYNADNVPDNFSFIPLKDLAGGTVINFTDFGWTSESNGFQLSCNVANTTGAVTDGAITWTAPAEGVLFGIQVTIVCGGASPSASLGTVVGLQATANSIVNGPTLEYMSLSPGGDQIFAFQGTLASPTLITAIGMNGPWDTSLPNCEFTSSKSLLPPSLNGTNSMAITTEVDNAIYNCSVTSGSASALRTAILNQANWTVDNNTAFPLPIACFGSCTDPTVPTVSATTPICAGGNSTLTITGTLNSATNWHIYTGSCGGTPVGTTSGATFMVSPGSTTTYYVRGQGGCVTPGSCGSTAVTVNPIQNAGFSYPASAYCVNAMDPTPTITGVSGGTFSSTAGLSINASSGVIDVSASTPGMYTVTYTTPGPCPGTSNQNITINALSNAGFNYSSASYCVFASDPTPTITGLSGGTFTSAPAGLSINAGTGTIDVSASTPGSYTVTYSVTGTCPNSSNVAVSINNLDNAGFNYGAASYCTNGSDPTPTITGLAGGSFTSAPAGLSINASTGTIDVSASTPGAYTITYTTSGPCPNSSNASVTINAMSNAGFNYGSSAYCVNATDPTPTITGMSGGSFTSAPAGLSINAGTGTIDVSASTPGAYTVTYSVSGTCPNSSNVAVTINGLDNASFNYGSAAYCANASDPTPTITGLAGGSFTSAPAGLSINASTGTIDVSASTPGAYTITYTTSGPCPNTANASVTINAVSNAGFNYGSSAYCVNASDPTPMITGMSGGSFTSAPAGLSINAGTGTIDVSASTPGAYTVTYSVSGTCPNSSNVAVTINALDNASFNYGSAAYCANASDPTPTITGLAGGSFTSAPAGLSINASTGTIDVSASTPGAYTITYTTSGPCPNTANASVTINAMDNAGFNYSAATYCINAVDPTPTITGLAGGSFTSAPAGLSINAGTGTIDVSTSTPGAYTVTYTTNGTCPNSSNVAVTINGLDNAGFNYGSTTYCAADSDPTPTITGLAGGMFTGAPAGLSINASTGTIDLSASMPGGYNVSYTTTGSCPNTSNVMFAITPLNTITLTSAMGTDAQSLLVNTTLVTITYATTGATGATFSGLPMGVMGSWAGNVATISGSPTEEGLFNYTINLTGGCGMVSISGSINISAGIVQIMGGAYFNSLQAAIDAAMPGQTIILLEDINEADVNVSNSVTIDANGFTLTIPSGNLTIPFGKSLTWSSSNLIIVLGADILNNGTLCNNGTIQYNNITPWTNNALYKGKGIFVGSFINNGSSKPGN